MHSSFVSDLHTVSDKLVLEVLSIISENKSIRFEKLLKNISIKSSRSKFLYDSDDRKKIKECLEILESKNFIKKNPSVVEDFDVYYITAKGLEASRRLPKFYF